MGSGNLGNIYKHHFPKFNMTYATFLLFGAVGGLARGFVGAYKNSMKVGSGKKISWGKMLFNILGAIVIGGVVGMVVDINPITALCSGYAGIDIIESVIKLSKH